MSNFTSKYTGPQIESILDSVQNLAPAYAEIPVTDGRAYLQVGKTYRIFAPRVGDNFACTLTLMVNATSNGVTTRIPAHTYKISSEFPDSFTFCPVNCSLDMDSYADGPYIKFVYRVDYSSGTSGTHKIPDVTSDVQVSLCTENQVVLDGATRVQMLNEDVKMQGLTGPIGETGQKGDSCYVAYAYSKEGTDFSESHSDGMRFIGIASGATKPEEKADYAWFDMSPTNSSVVTTTHVFNTFTEFWTVAETGQADVFHHGDIVRIMEANVPDFWYFEDDGGFAGEKYEYTYNNTKYELTRYTAAYMAVIGRFYPIESDVSREEMTKALADTDARINWIVNNRLPVVNDDIVRIKGNVVNPDIKIRYYTSLKDAMTAVCNKDIEFNASKKISNTSVCAAYWDKLNDTYGLILLKTISVPQITYEIDVSLKIIFAGHYLTFSNCEGITKWKFSKHAYLDGTLGGGIAATFKNSDIIAYAMLFRDGCTIDGGSYSFSGGEGHAHNVCLFSVTSGEAIFKNLTFEMTTAGTGQCRGLVSCLANKLFVDNVKITVSGTDGVDTSQIHGLYFNNGSEVCVKNTNITVLAKSRVTYTYGMSLIKGKLVELENNTVYVDAANNDAGKPEHGGLGYACVIYTGVEKAVITGGSYEGVMVGISIYAKLALISGGKFVSCSHGGFYYSPQHEDAKCYVKNAQIGTCVYSGIFNQIEMGNKNPLGSFYVSSSNSEVHVDNCEYLFTDDTQYAGGVLRNDDDGKTSLNMSLYISNVAVPEGHKLRADIGNHVYVGTGTNITKDNMCVIYAKPIDEATLVYTGYNEYTYENDYANKKCENAIANTTNALKTTKSGVTVSIDDISPISHQVNVGLSAKNFMYFPTATTKTFAGGVTWTATAGTPEFTLNGTATKEDASSLVGAFPMKAGTYKVSTRGLKAVSGNNRIYVKPEGGSIVNNIYDGSSKEITLTEDCTIAIQLIIAAGSSYTNTPVQIVIERVLYEPEVTITVVDDLENPTITKTATIDFYGVATFDSIAPNMVLYSNNDGVDLNVTYNWDINKAMPDAEGVKNAAEEVSRALEHVQDVLIMGQEFEDTHDRVIDHTFRIGMIEDHLGMGTPFVVVRTTSSTHEFPQNAKRYARIVKIFGRKLENAAGDDFENCEITEIRKNDEVIFRWSANRPMWCGLDYLYHSNGKWIYHSGSYVCLGNYGEAEAQKIEPTDKVYAYVPYATIFERTTPIEEDVTESVDCDSIYVDISDARQFTIASTKNQLGKNGGLEVMYEV